MGIATLEMHMERAHCNTQSGHCLLNTVDLMLNTVDLKHIACEELTSKCKTECVHSGDARAKSSVTQHVFSHHMQCISYTSHDIAIAMCCLDLVLQKLIRQHQSLML